MFKVENHGSIFLFRATTPDALEDARDLFSHAQWLGDSFAVEPRYAEAIVEQLRAEGYGVE